MATTLTNVSHIVGSVFHPSRTSVIALEGATVDTAEPAETDTGVDITLGRKKPSSPTSNPLRRQGRQAQPRVAPAIKVEALASPQLVISPAFKLVVIIVFVLILLFGVATVLLAILGNPANAALQSASSVMSTALTASVGAILGLIGGKAVV
jgi:hypothetical protein